VKLLLAEIFHEIHFPALMEEFGFFLFPAYIKLMEKNGFPIFLPEKKGQSDLFSVTYGIFRTKTGLTPLTSGKNRIISPWIVLIFPEVRILNPGMSSFFRKF
jgi:hypothetical protein